MMLYRNWLLKPLFFAGCLCGFICLFLNESHSSDADLKWIKLGKGSILITKGFEYRKDMKLGYKNTIVIEGIDKGVFTAKGGVSFVPLFNETEESKKARQKAKQKGDFYLENISDAIGNEWIFPNKGMTFNVYTDDSVFKFQSLKNNAKIEFREDGVLVTGFDIMRVKPR